MGLDFRAEGIPYEAELGYDERAHWSYSGFHRFRQRLAAQLGIDLARFWSDQSYRQKSVGCELYALLNHSDCDGALSKFDCDIMSRALALAVWNWPLEDYDRINALKLARQMRFCVEFGNGRLLFK